MCVRTDELESQKCLSGRPSVEVIRLTILFFTLNVTVRRGEGGGMSDHFFVDSAEIGGWMEECREVGECEKCVEGE